MLGASSCLLGETVRYDRSACREDFLKGSLEGFVRWRSVCPEVEIGMGVPRPTIRLVPGETADDDPRLIEPKSGDDWTHTMQTYAKRRVGELQRGDLDGYVLKRASPSCGMERIKVWGSSGPLSKNGVGVFALALQRLWPDLPLEEEGRLNDPNLRHEFVERIFCRNRWRVLDRGERSRARLVEFHTAHKLLLRAHDEGGYGRLGRLVGEPGKRTVDELYAEYAAEFHATLARRTTRKRHVNVLQHVLGYFKELLEPREKQTLVSAIEDYRLGILPLIVPVSMLKKEVEQHREPYLSGQLYLDPFPKELSLRNRI